MEEQLNQLNAVLQSMQQTLQCNICLDLLNSPLTTKCGHSYCAQCIQQVVKGPRSSAQCPLCLTHITRRSLGQNNKISGLVAAVRKIIDSIKKDCCFEVSPSKYRPRPHSITTAEDDNSENEENDEPRRGTRKRGVTIHYNPEVYVPKARARPAKQRILASRGGQELSLHTDGKPQTVGADARLSNCNENIFVNAISKEHSYSSPTKQEPLEKPSLIPSFSRGKGNRSTGLVQGRSRLAGTRGRGVPVMRKYAKDTRKSPATYQGKKKINPKTTDLLSVSQQCENIEYFSKEGIHDDESTGNLSEKLGREKPADKVAKWLHNSSEVGFRIGASHSTDTTSITDSESSQILIPAKSIALENHEDPIQTSESNSSGYKASTEKHIYSNKSSLSSKKSESSVASLSRTRKFFKSKDGKASSKMAHQNHLEEAETQLFDPVEYTSNTSDPYNFTPSQKSPKSKKAPAKRDSRVKMRGRGALSVSHRQVRGRSRGRGVAVKRAFEKTDNSLCTDLDINSSVQTHSTPISKGTKLIKNVNLSVIKPPDITTDLTQEKQLEPVILLTHDEDDDNDIPDSCPVNTKDKFDVLVSEVKENIAADLNNISSLSVNHIVEEEKEANLIFVTPAQAEEPNNVDLESKLQRKKGSKKRSVSESDSENEAKRKPKAKKKENISDLNSTSNSSNRSLNIKTKKSKAEKAKEEVEAICSMFEDIEDHHLSITSIQEVEKSKQIKVKEKENLLREDIFVMNQTFENTQLNKTILPLNTKDKIIMPPPKAPMNNKKVRFNANTSLQLGGLCAPEEASATSASSRSTKLSAGKNTASKGSRNVRYASEMKSKLIDTNKSVAVSVNVKSAKSPGWSHVEGARKDLKVRQTSLNITGGEQCNINDSRTEGGTCGHSLMTVSSSNETDVIIDEQTQEFDVEHLSSSQSKKDRVKKLKEIVSQLHKGDEKQKETKKLKVKLKRNNISPCKENNENIKDQEMSPIKIGSNITDRHNHSRSKYSFPNEAESSHNDEKVHCNSPVKNASIMSSSQSVPTFNKKVGQKIFPSQEKGNKKEFDGNEKKVHSLPKLTRRTFSLTLNSQDLDVLNSACESARESPNVSLRVGSSPTKEKKTSEKLGNSKVACRETTSSASSSIAVSKPHPPHHTMSPSLTSGLLSKTTVSPCNNPCEVNASDETTPISSQKSPEKNLSIDSQVGHEAQVVPFKSVGPLCSERCSKAADDASLFASVGGVGRDLCLHSIPCEVYQVLMKYMALMVTQHEKHKTCCSDTQVSKTGKIIESAESDMNSKNSVSHEKKLKGNLEHQEHEAVAGDLVECVISEQNKAQTINELYEKPNVADDSEEKHESISDRNLEIMNISYEEHKTVLANKVVPEGSSCPEKEDIRKSSEEFRFDHDSETVPSSYNTEDMIVALPMPSFVGVQTHAKRNVEFISSVCEKATEIVHLSAERSREASSTEKLTSPKIENSKVLNVDQTVTLESYSQSSETLVDKCSLKSLISPTEISPSSQMQDTQSSQQSTSLLAPPDITENKSVLASKNVCPTENIVSMEGNPSEKNERRMQSQKNKEKTMVPRTIGIDEELVETEKENLESTNNFQPTINRPRRKPLQSGQPVLENIMTQVNKDDKKPSTEKEELSWIESQISQDSIKIIPSQNRPTNSKPLFFTDSSARPNKSQKGNLINAESSAMGNKDLEISDEDSPLKEPPDSLKCSFKRIRRPTSSSSSSEDSDSGTLINPPKRKPKVFSSSGSNPSSTVQETQKNSEIVKEHTLDSEEMRDLERLDQNVWEFFGHPDEDLMNKRDDDQNSHISIDDDDPSQNVKNQIEYDEPPPVTLSLLSDDELPSTAEVMENVSADMAIIRKMREEKVKDPSPQETWPSASIPTLTSSTNKLFTKVNKSLTKAEALLEHDTIDIIENLITPQEEKARIGKPEKSMNFTKVTKLSSDYKKSQDSQALEVIGASDQETEDEIDNVSHSSAYSSQSEAINTQKQKQVKDEVAMLKARVRELEAAMKNKNASEVGEKNPELDVLPPTCHSIDSGDESEELFSSFPDLTESPKPKLLQSKNQTQVEKPSRFVRNNVKRPHQLVCTGLNSSEMGKVQDLVNKLGTPGSSFKRSWDEDISHVVVKTEPDRLAQRTLKYLYGVAAGCWVITLQWVLDSLSSKKFLPEEDYEVLDCTGTPGPKKGRTNSVPLFSNCEFYIKPPFVDVTVQQLKELMELCGAQIVDSPFKFSQNKQSMKLVVVQTDCDHDTEEALTKYKRVCVAHDWIIECIGMCAHICIAPYIIGNPDQSHLAASCLPQSLLEETQELQC